MGFGIITIGFLSLLLIDWGGSVLSGAVLAYGLYLASRLEPKFRVGAVCGLCMMPHGVILLLEIVGNIDIDTVLKTTTEVLMLLGWAGMTVMFISGVGNIARDNQSKKLVARCNGLLYINILYFVCELGVKLFPFPQMSVILMIAKYVFVIIDTLFAHYCFVHISTAEQTAKDLADVAAIEKKEKDRKAAREQKYQDAMRRRK